MRIERFGDITMYCGDCLEVLPTLAAGSVDAVITDPPYPDYYQGEYRYNPDAISVLNSFSVRQFIFWTAKADFPLDYTAIHIWDKKTGAGSEYERIFERNGQRNFKVFRYYLINSTVAASFTGDEFTGHKSQKPIRLMRDIVRKYTTPAQSILDPFAGSGTTLVAAVRLGRKGIGIEIDERYFDIACRRIEQAQLQMRLPLDI